MIDTERKVGEMAAERPGAAQVFACLGIDFCCGGDKSFDEACAAANVSPEQVMRALENATRPQQEERDWNRAPLPELIDHIVSTHHAYTRSALSRLEELLPRVRAKHAEKHPELGRVDGILCGLSSELRMHMMKEEQILFPYIVEMEEAASGNRTLPPAMFGTVENPVRMMMLEHDSAGSELRALREATGGFVPPEDACASFRALYRKFADLESDLQMHIHLENNILFPRAIRLEGEAR
jgi:regulator of cell morphogenesis and NO signaling